MKKFLIGLFFIVNSSLYPSEKIVFNNLVNSRTEAMGSTGMIFGKEVGSFFYAPTAILSTEGFYSFSLINASVNPFSLFEIKSKKSSLYIGATVSLPYFRIGNFAIGSFLNGIFHINKDKIFSRVYAFVPLSFAYSYKSISFGIGAKMLFRHPILAISDLDKYVGSNFESNGGYLVHLSNTMDNIKSFNGFNSDISFMYENFLGKFSIALNNFFSIIYSHTYDVNNIENAKVSDLKNKGDIFIRNLKVGYGREFELNMIADNVKLAIELDNLLMGDIALRDSNNYNFLEKLKIGSEFSLSLAGVGVDLRTGLSNFFPTFGLGLNLFNIFELGYSYSYKLVMKENFTGFHCISLNLGYF